MSIQEYLDQKFANYPNNDEFEELHESLSNNLNTFIHEKVAAGITEEEATKQAFDSLDGLDDLLEAMAESQPDFSKAYTFYNKVLNSVNELTLENEIQVNLESVDEIHFSYHHGVVTIIPSLDNEIHVREFMSRRIEKIFTEATKIGNVLNIQQGPRKLVGIFREKIEIAIPNEFAGFITLFSNLGNVNIINFQSESMFDLTSKSGNAKFINFKSKRLQTDLSSGNIYGKNLASQDLHFNSKSGNIKLSNVLVEEKGGQMAISSNSGSVKLEQVKAGNLVIESKSGNIKGIDADTENFDVKTTSGTLKLQNLTGAGQVTSKNGNLTLDFAKLTDDLTIENHSGNVKLIFDPTTDYLFEIQTKNGALKTPFQAKVTNFQGQKISGQVGHFPKIKVGVKTSTGNVKIF